MSIEELGGKYETITGHFT